MSNFDSHNTARASREYGEKDSVFDAKNIAAFITWGIIFALSVYFMTRMSIEQPSIYFQVSALFLMYAASFLVLAQDSVLGFRFAYQRTAALMTMLLSAFLLGFLLQFDFLSILTIIWAAVISYYVSLRRAISTVVIVVLLWFAMISYQQNQLHWIQAILYGSFHMFALLLATSNKRERGIAEALHHKNAELQATQTLLTEVSKQAERTRIARDLHDLLGHHLTALTIKLQVASRLSEGEAKSQVDECHAVAKLLLSDVREAVSSLRESGSIDFTQAVRLLADKIPKPKVHLTVDDSFFVENITKAQTLLRCVQETITNSMKHSGAENLWINMSRKNAELTVKIVDDGDIDNNWQKGNGIRGMEERLSECGGSLSLSLSDRSLQTVLTVPV